MFQLYHESSPRVRVNVNGACFCMRLNEIEKRRGLRRKLFSFYPPILFSFHPSILFSFYPSIFWVGFWEGNNCNKINYTVLRLIVMD